MELTFEEYCDADLSLIRDYYETTFSHYVPDLAERIFVVRDAHWLVGAVRLRDEQGGKADVDGGSVHIDGGAERQTEAGHVLLDTQVFLGTFQCDR